MTDYQELKTLAEAATPGPWKTTVDGVMPQSQGFGICANFGSTNGQANREFIAAAHPATVLAMIDELYSMREFKEHMTEMREADGFSSWAEALVAVDELRKEVEALRKDAERYRWLRRVGGRAWTHLESEGPAKGSLYDSCVDSAMGKVFDHD